MKKLGASRAVLIPQSWLGLLPLHAAWLSDSEDSGRRYCMDEITFAYAPNASALSKAIKTGLSISTDALLAVDGPFSDEDATFEEVRDALGEHNVLHFSCHGMTGFIESFKGGLLMARDRMLTLADILPLDLTNSRLAVLSACETGRTGLELPDEAIGLPNCQVPKPECSAWQPPSGP